MDWNLIKTPHFSSKDGPGTDPVILDFEPPFERVSIVEGLEKELKVKLPDPTTYGTEGWFFGGGRHGLICSCLQPRPEPAEARAFFDQLCVKHNVDCKAPRTVSRLIDKVSVRALKLSLRPSPITHLRQTICNHPATACRRVPREQGQDAPALHYRAPADHEPAGQVVGVVWGLD